MGRINLGSYSFRANQPDYRSGDILRRARLEQEQKDVHQFSGLVSSGEIEIQQGTGSSGWAVSSLIEFPYRYFGKPTPYLSLDGTYSGNLHDSDGTPLDGVHETLGNNDYGPELPPALQALIDAEDVTTWSPAMFETRIVHWVIENGVWFTGCYILVMQINPECTEENKKMRLHYSMVGQGVTR